MSIPLEEYLRTSYRPDRESKNGVVMERNRGGTAANAGYCRLFK